MARFIDRRFNSRNKNAVNRARFIRRFKNQIQESVREAVSNRSIKDIDSSGEKISIPAKDIHEPKFAYGKGGVRNIILPGNSDYIPGDTIKRQEEESAGGGSGGNGNSPDSGQDDFIFEISKEEFLDIFFDDLALPNLVKKHIFKTPAFKMVRAGFTNQGTPANINISRSVRNAIGRKIALLNPKKKRLLALQEELTVLEQDLSSVPHRLQLTKEIEELSKKIHNTPFIDPIDLKYNHRVKRHLPATQAVMFCLMDVSGSMDEMKKDIAKRFFILLYLFLSKTYENVELVFIRHHTSAKEVNEQDFFYSRETGGTVVSSALELMKNAMERYSSDWNIYAAQASDGDNWNNDSPRCHDILVHDILPQVQYFAYVEIMPRQHQSLWEAYLVVKDKFPQFAMQSIETAKDIYPVFRELFKRQEYAEAHKGG